MFNFIIVYIFSVFFLLACSLYIAGINPEFTYIRVKEFLRAIGREEDLNIDVNRTEAIFKSCVYMAIPFIRWILVFTLLIICTSNEEEWYNFIEMLKSHVK